MSLPKFPWLARTSLGHEQWLWDLLGEARESGEELGAHAYIRLKELRKVLGRTSIGDISRSYFLVLCTCLPLCIVFLSLVMVQKRATKPPPLTISYSRPWLNLYYIENIFSYFHCSILALLSLRKSSLKCMKCDHVYFLGLKTITYKNTFLGKKDVSSSGIEMTNLF